MTTPQIVRVVPTGDAALTAELEPRLDVTINCAAVAIGDRVRQAGLAGVRDVVVTAAAVTVYADPLIVDWAGLERLLREPVALERIAFVEPAPLLVPVTYGGDDGPDLDEVARACSCSAAEVVARHTARPYRVFMLGFLPGFAYLGPLDERLRVARRATPRARVPSGSVAIAGAQTAIYPSDSPGGWSIIGRTAWRPFDMHRVPACPLAVGGMLRFERA